MLRSYLNREGVYSAAGTGNTSGMRSFQKKRVNLWIFTLFLFFDIMQCAHARWATKEDATFIRHYDDIFIDVRSDASYTTTRDFEDEILKEPARQEAGLFYTAYNSQSSTFKVLEASTILGQEQIPVDPSFIQDKPLASSQQGFDQINQVMIAFPKVDIGARIHFKYSLDTFQIPFKGFFSQSIAFGQQRYDQKKKLVIRSELPLVFASHDPQKYLEIKEWKAENRYFFSVRLRRPIYRRIVDEQKISVNKFAYPWVDIASTKDWTEMARKVSPDFEKVLRADLPSPFERIRKRAGRGQNTSEKINIVTSLLADSLHYLGDWRPINGTHIPRPLATIAKTKFGDCKDFSAATVAILRKLGITAHIALIKRGVNPDFSPTDIPSTGEFNHAIVWVKDGESVFWIDPTNQNSYAQGIMEDIVDRRSLILDPENPSLGRTPKSKPEDALVDIQLRLEPESQEKFHISGEITYGGRSAIPFVGAELNHSKKTLDYKLISGIGDMNRIADWKIGNYDLSSRIVSDVHFDFRYTEEDTDFRTTAGSAVPISSNWLAQGLLVKTKERESDLFLGEPINYLRKIHVRNIEVVGDQSLSCDISTPWVDIRRAYAKENDGITVLDTVRLKTSIIEARDIHTAKFEALQKELRNCFDGTAIIYKMKK